ncbi:cation:proton antiporter [Cyanobium sp. NIES-981]|uniref:cation:proton antiporter domain-containing protein n=1 Tax=Cyanobium sp. NIES-981 TaxID=1851505 RepID=UPI0007DDE0BE|nr:cation:proton antiporter [Cyanobium sp. NIES-981]SBO42828.1 Transporter, CPA2 family protein [Cyanobium sp. NIES-981]
MAEPALPFGGAIGPFLEQTPLAVFALLLGLSVLVPPVARLLKLPDLVGLLAAGVLIGPHALGWVDSQTPTVGLLSDVGVIYLLFIAGLEIDLAEFARIRQRSFRFGLLTFSLPLLGGAALGLASGFGWLSAVLLGSVLASHTPLGYPIVRSYGAMREESVIVAIGGTIFTDLAALLLLALCMGLNRGELTPIGILALLTRVGLFAAVVVALITRLGRDLVRRSVNNESQLFVAVVLALFLAALGAELAGVEKIVGAFLAGLAVNHVLPEGRVKEQVIFVGAALFIPIFFIDLGLLLDLPGFLGTMLAGPFALALIATLIATKGLAAWWAGRIYRYNHAQILTLWSLSLPQVAATLAATFVGYRAGLFDATVLNSVLAMMVVTASLGPTLTAKAMPLLGQAAAAAIGAGLNGSLALARRPLRVLVPVSNPSTEAPLLGLASLLIHGDGEDPGQVLPLVVVSPAQAVATAMATAMAEARALLARAASLLGAERVPCQTLLRVDSDVAAGIARVAIEQATDLVVMGLAPPAGLGQWLFGDLVDATCRQVSSPVVVARLQQDPESLRRLLVPVKDLTAGALEQFQLAERLAVARSGSITLLHVVESGRSRRARQEVEQRLASWRRGAGGSDPGVPIEVRVVLQGSGGGVERCISAAARHHDLVILRSQRRLVAGLPIPASDRVDRLLRRLEGSVLVISDPLH